jgi:hypothetical protein
VVCMGVDDNGFMEARFLLINCGVTEGFDWWFYIEKQWLLMSSMLTIIKMTMNFIVVLTCILKF